MKLKTVVNESFGPDDDILDQYEQDQISYDEAKAKLKELYSGRGAVGRDDLDLAYTVLDQLWADKPDSFTDEESKDWLD